MELIDYVIVVMFALNALGAVYKRNFHSAVGWAEAALFYALWVLNFGH